jgi:hypothetical protein
VFPETGGAGGHDFVEATITEAPAGRSPLVGKSYSWEG